MFDTSLSDHGFGCKKFNGWVVMMDPLDLFGANAMTVQIVPGIFWFENNINLLKF